MENEKGAGETPQGGDVAGKGEDAKLTAAIKIMATMGMLQVVKSDRAGYELKVSLNTPEIVGVNYVSGSVAGMVRDAAKKYGIQVKE